MTVASSDTQVRQDILDEVRHDVRIDATNLLVDVTDGVVHLRGTVPTYFQKITAGADAQRIKGVRDVHNDLVVTLIAPWTDAEIADTVRANLARDVRITNPADIHVAVANGVVTLTGPVGTYSQRSDAEDDSWTAPGVVNVVNNITVVPPVVRNDDAIANDVRSALTTDPAVDARNITVLALKGTVYLRGSVPTYYQIRQAADDAWGIAGVLNVVNELGVAF
jgi:osmotically-inducible protein OsmY